MIWSSDGQSVNVFKTHPSSDNQTLYKAHENIVTDFLGWLQNTIIKTEVTALEFPIRSTDSGGSGFQNKSASPKLTVHEPAGGGISRVFLYLFMICVYICPTHQLKYLLYIITAVDVEGKTKRHG